MLRPRRTIEHCEQLPDLPERKITAEGVGAHSAHDRNELREGLG